MHKRKQLKYSSLATRALSDYNYVSAADGGVTYCLIINIKSKFFLTRLSNYDSFQISGFALAFNTDYSLIELAVTAV